MRHGELKISRSLRPLSADGRVFALEVADDDGTFDVIGSEWIHIRWAGAAPIAPSTPSHWRSIEQMLLREARTRRHAGVYDPENPMNLDHPIPARH
ncbi:hypothetical protein [Sphingomonas crocodyli]|uniref:Uncharacterized protein n=1 Tax=Sphingomonas crocodyli TaxID=1979270 RepID=A0A437LYD3_9SPHN|nr:hypothetical protein [Sphingomonas crocodyli]RVT90392.1 hypothetical protein EOD43_19200 [Sphingomonas crocodyli]